MNTFKPVSISTSSFAFCRYTVAALVWLALIFTQKWLLLLVFAIMVFSWLLKIEKAPLIVLCKVTYDRWIKPQRVMVDEGGLRFAHLMGALMSLMAFLLWVYIPGDIGWYFTLFLAVMKTSAAVGRCSALKLYNCMQSGDCCRIGRYMRKKRNA